MRAILRTQPRLTLERIRAILDDVKFSDREFLLMRKGDGFLVQMRYLEADIERPDAGPVEQKTRKWYVSPFMTEGELVETCFAMVCRSQMHVAAEHFTYKGRRVYSPHFDVRARIALCDAGSYDKRKPRT